MTVNELIISRSNTHIPFAFPLVCVYRMCLWACVFVCVHPAWIQLCWSNNNLCSPIWQQQSGDVTLSGGVCDRKNKNAFSCETATFHRIHLDPERCDNPLLHNTYFQLCNLIGQSWSQLGGKNTQRARRVMLLVNIRTWFASERLLLLSGNSGRSQIHNVD